MAVGTRAILSNPTNPARSRQRAAPSTRMAPRDRRSREQVGVGWCLAAEAAAEAKDRARQRRALALPLKRAAPTTPRCLARLRILGSRARQAACTDCRTCPPVPCRNRVPRAAATAAEGRGRSSSLRRQPRPRACSSRCCLFRRRTRRVARRRVAQGRAPWGPTSARGGGRAEACACVRVSVSVSVSVRARVCVSVFARARARVRGGGRSVRSCWRQISGVLLTDVRAVPQVLCAAQHSARAVAPIMLAHAWVCVVRFLRRLLHGCTYQSSGWFVCCWAAPYMVGIRISVSSSLILIRILFLILVRILIRILIS